MAQRKSWLQCLAVLVHILAVGSARSQTTVSLAERRTVVVDGQTKVITSKLSRLNPNTSRVRAVMDLDFTYNVVHRDGKPLIESTLNRLAAQEGWTVTHYYYQDPNHSGVDDRSKITLAELNKNLAVFANHISNWGNQGNGGINAAVQAYMEETGGGMVLVHGSGDSYNASWTYYAEKLHPVQWQGYGSYSPGTIFRPEAAAAHPILEGGILSEEKVIYGEWFRYEKLITAVNPKAEVLIKADTSQCTGCGYIGKWAFAGGTPISWVMPVGKGWVGYFGEGHSDATQAELTQEVWDRFFKQMLFYVAGYDTASAAVALPAYARDHSGISFDEAAMAVFIEKQGYHKVGLYGVDGKKYDEAAGSGVMEYGFESTRKRLKTGMYLLRVEYGKSGTATKRYVVRN